METKNRGLFIATQTMLMLKSSVRVRRSFYSFFSEMAVTGAEIVNRSADNAVGFCIPIGTGLWGGRLCSGSNTPKSTLFIKHEIFFFYSRVPKRSPRSN